MAVEIFRGPDHIAIRTDPFGMGPNFESRRQYCQFGFEPTLS